MADLAAIITAATGLLALFGAGMRFLWNKLERRFDKIEEELSNCEARRGVQLTVIELLWSELHRLAPYSPVFSRAKKLLDDLKREHEV